MSLGVMATHGALNPLFSVRIGEGQPFKSSSDGIASVLRIGGHVERVGAARRRVFRRRLFFGIMGAKDILEHEQQKDKGAGRRRRNC